MLVWLTWTNGGRLTLDHMIIVAKVKQMHDTEIAWFISYLSDCVQHVRYNGTYLEWGIVSRGISQGSGL